MTRVDRDELLARVDLAALADELLGMRRGRGSGVKWPCPVHQPQTGLTPPLSVFVTARGEQRWHCHACGEGGTAIDMVIAAYRVDVRAAINLLASRAHFHPVATIDFSTPVPPSVSREGHAILAAHVTRCERLLWHPHGAAVREWLHRRGFTDDTLHRHRIGADPGPRILNRPRGLPWRGAAAIFPVLEAGEILYYQARYLDVSRAGGRKYDNPATAIAPNPRLATITPARVPPGAAVFVCEGLPDALSVSQAGHRAVAVLGVGVAGPRLAQHLLDRYHDVPVRIAFDTDARGIQARDALFDALGTGGHGDVMSLMPASGSHDLNDWLRVDRDGFRRGLDLASPRADRAAVNCEIDLGLEL
ncbi:MAG: toprim domain-containing protein [Acidimicrobiia bacterium]